MDAIQRDTMFAGLSDREIVEAVAVEMKRRSMFGCVFMMPAAGAKAVFASCVPPDSMTHATAAQQLTVFAEVAAQSLGERTARIVAEDDTSFDPKYLN
jgi:hypothetical protein